MPYTEEHLETARRNVIESEKRVDRQRNVIGHLRKHGQPTDTAEAQLSQFHLMSRLYRERRDQIEAIIKRNS
jgi:hypothetical protein